MPVTVEGSSAPEGEFLSFYTPAILTLRNLQRGDLFTGVSMLVIDEADFGVHKLGQSQPLVDAINETVYTIIMTGTNADKAASIFPVDHFTSVTYPELLIQKKETHAKTLSN